MAGREGKRTKRKPPHERGRREAEGNARTSRRWKDEHPQYKRQG